MANFKPKFTITNKIAFALSVIERARGFLEAATLSNDWVKDMQSRALTKEAYHTTHIEGTQLTLAQSEELMAGKTLKNTDPDDVRELLNYRQAFELVADYLGDGQAISEGLVREIHKRLVVGVRENAAEPGQYRRIQNYVANAKTKEVIYTPPPAYEMQPMMAELVDWINHEKEICPVLVAGIAQFQLMHIHPFLDGNGRTARLLSTLCLYRQGYDFKRLFSVSEYYDRNRVDYYRAIQNVRENAMDMTSWLEYFSQALSTQLEEVKELGAKAIKRDVMTKRFNLSLRQGFALEYVLKVGHLTIQDYEKLCPNTTRRTLQRELKELVDRHIFTRTGATNKLIYRLHESIAQLAIDL